MNLRAPWRPHLVLAGVLLIIPWLAIHAEAEPTPSEADFVVPARIPLKFEEVDRPSFLPPTVGPRVEGAAASATIVVSYVGFPANARTAFEYAKGIWEQQLTSGVTIRVTAEWTNLGSGGTLGAAGPALLVPSGAIPNAPIGNSYYPIALANKLAGTDLSPANPDIIAEFNSNYANWYYGLDGKTPAGKADFVTTVLHELGHGLGFVGSMNGEGTIGCWGSTRTDGSCPAGSGAIPYVFDRFAANGGNQVLVSAFANNSSALRGQLTGDSLYWNGSAGTAATGARPRLYAPTFWEGGSSFSHLDEDSYPAGSPNSLMTPLLSGAEAIHDPGPITRGVFADMGWSTTSPGPTATTPPASTPTRTAVPPSPTAAPPTPTPQKQIISGGVLLRFPKR